MRDVNRLADTNLPLRSPHSGSAPDSHLVHVWHARLDHFNTDELRPLLSPDELTRAARFYFDRDRHRFIVCRALLRTLLADALDSHPAALKFAYGHAGKPHLTGGLLHFNVSHGQDHALLAFTTAGEIGVDVEVSRRFSELDDIAERFFSPPEVAALHALPEDEQSDAFFRCWTRKEAYIKARGDGLGWPLDRFAVSLTAADPARLLWVADAADDVAHWSMHDIPLPDGARGAVAVRRPHTAVVLQSMTAEILAGLVPQVCGRRDASGM
jgi:4'-phosphopantetheinyl transferase